MKRGVEHEDVGTSLGEDLVRQRLRIRQEAQRSKHAARVGVQPDFRVDTGAPCRCCQQRSTKAIREGERATSVTCIRDGKAFAALIEIVGAGVAGAILGVPGQRGFREGADRFHSRCRSALRHCSQQIQLGINRQADVLVFQTGHIDLRDMRRVTRPFRRPRYDRCRALLRAMLLGVGVAEIVERRVTELRQHDGALGIAQLIEGRAGGGSVSGPVDDRGLIGIDDERPDRVEVKALRPRADDANELHRRKARCGDVIRTDVGGVGCPIALDGKRRAGRGRHVDEVGAIGADPHGHVIKLRPVAPHDFVDIEVATGLIIDRRCGEVVRHRTRLGQSIAHTIRSPR